MPKEGPPNPEFDNLKTAELAKRLVELVLASPNLTVFKETNKYVRRSDNRIMVGLLAKNPIASAEQFWADANDDGRKLTITIKYAPGEPGVQLIWDVTSETAVTLNHESPERNYYAITTPNKELETRRCLKLMISLLAQ